MIIIRKILLHTAVICSFVCMIARLLDWYNPFMDFSRHTDILQIILYVTVPVFFLLLPKRAPKRQNENSEK